MYFGFHWELSVERVGYLRVLCFSLRRLLSIRRVCLLGIEPSVSRNESVVSVLLCSWLARCVCSSIHWFCALLLLLCVFRWRRDAVASRLWANGVSTNRRCASSSRGVACVRGVLERSHRRANRWTPFRLRFASRSGRSRCGTSRLSRWLARRASSSSRSSSSTLVASTRSSILLSRDTNPTDDPSL